MGFIPKTRSKNEQPQFLGGVDDPFSRRHLDEMQEAAGGQQDKEFISQIESKQHQIQDNHF